MMLTPLKEYQELRKITSWCFIFTTDEQTHLDRGQILGPMSVQQGGTASKQYKLKQT